MLSPGAVVPKSLATDLPPQRIYDIPVEYCNWTSKAAAAKQTLRAAVNATVPFSAGTGMSNFNEVAICAEYNLL